MRCNRVNRPEPRLPGHNIVMTFEDKFGIEINGVKLYRYITLSSDRKIL